MQRMPRWTQLVPAFAVLFFATGAVAADLVVRTPDAARISALPDSLPVTSRAGHPMLISTMSAPWSATMTAPMTSSTSGSEVRARNALTQSAGDLLARGVARTRELAVRTALGGTRWRLVRQLLVQLLGFIAITPLAGWLTDRVVARSGSAVISNYDIARFVLSPAGVVFVLLAVVGLSAQWHRPSYFAAKYMLEHGYRVTWPSAKKVIYGN